MALTTPRLKPETRPVRLWWARHSVTALRLSLGIVFLAFGVTKFIPGVSPVRELVEHTVGTLTFGIVTGTAAMVVTATIETFIGLTLVTGWGLRAGLFVLLASMVPIMSPLVLFPGELFPGGLPTLEAQYVFKDLVLAAGTLVVTAKAMGEPL
jgi:uncharacterized membrane protein YkgB